MIKTASQLRGDLKEIWPRLRHVWFFDREYWVPDLDEVKILIAEARPKIEPYVQFRGEFGDCDDHSLFLIGEIRKQIIEMAIAGEFPAEQLKPRPIGRAMGMKFRGKGPAHSLGMSMTRGGVYFFEGHEDRIWKGNSENDWPFFTSA